MDCALRTENKLRISRKVAGLLICRILFSSGPYEREFRDIPLAEDSVLIIILILQFVFSWIQFWNKHKTFYQFLNTLTLMQYG